MKKIVIALIVLALAVLIFIGFQSFSNRLPSYVSVVSDSSVANYQGVPYYQKPRNLVAFDLDKIPNVKLMEFNATQKLFDARPSDNEYAFLDFNYNKELRLINLQRQNVETFPFPEIPAYVIDYEWLGNQILLHYFSAGGLTAGTGVNRDTPRDDHFYFFDPDTKKYIPITVDAATSQYTAHDYSVYFVKKSDSSKEFAVSVCSGRDSLGECNRYGFSISNGTSIKKLFDLKGSFTWGWQGENFFVKSGEKVYIVNPAQVPW